MGVHSCSGPIGEGGVAGCNAGWGVDVVWGAG